MKKKFKWRQKRLLINQEISVLAFKYCTTKDQSIKERVFVINKSSKWINDCKIGFYWKKD
ncbi:hypothetical protein NECAME_03710 [Necator americanus]|uniref:Uncharacterized protein n=1 Tax=Necator americanus TaxID=51031 RepID=W2T0I9_NECAM|nr:hypothetical protein NECAME_03710 [Necator americanus]ETN75520.1 hypothetical protein NECAME_03710 [Necator americanus]